MQTSGYVNDSRRAGLQLAQAFFEGAPLSPTSSRIPLDPGEMCLGDAEVRLEHAVAGQWQVAGTGHCQITDRRFSVQTDGITVDYWFAHITRADCDGHCIHLVMPQQGAVRLVMAYADYWFVMFNKAAYQRVVWPPLPDGGPATPSMSSHPNGVPHQFGAQLHGQPASASAGGIPRAPGGSAWRMFGPFAGESFFGMKTTVGCGLLGVVGGIALAVDYFSDGHASDGLICLVLAALSVMTLVITKFGSVRDSLTWQRKALAVLGIAGPLLVVAFVAAQVVMLLAALAVAFFILLFILPFGGRSSSRDPFRYVEALDNPERYRQRQERGY